MRLATGPLVEPVPSEYPDRRSYEMARVKYFHRLLAPLYIVGLIFVGISFIVAS